MLDQMNNELNPDTLFDTKELASNLFKELNPSGLSDEELQAFEEHRNYVEQILLDNRNKEVSPSDNSMYETDKLGDIFNQALQDPSASIQSNIRESISRDREYRYQKMKELSHGLSHEYSTEQSLVDLYHINRLSKEKPEVLTPDQALALSKQAGVEIKVDKPITRGQLEYSINKQLRIKELERDLAFYSETKDYNVLQNLMIGLSAVSGGIGFWESAAMAGMSILGGQAAAAGLAKAAVAIDRTSKISKGVKMAQKAIIAEKAAMRYAHDASEIGKATKALASKLHGQYLTAAQKEGLAGKLGYDVYRMGVGAAGQHASLATTMMPFAVDGVLTSVPSELVKYTGDKAVLQNNYNTKQVFATTLLNGAIGAGLPVAGTLIKKMPSIMEDVYEVLTKKISKDNQEKYTKAVLKGYGELGETIQKEDTQLKEIFKEGFDIASNKKINPETVATAVAIAGSNLTDDEFHTLLTHVIDALKNGKKLSTIESLPFKNKYYSNVLGMLDTITEATKSEMTHADFIKLLEEQQIPLQWSKTVEPTGNNFKDFLVTFKKNMLDMGVKIQNEKGALGRTFAHGLTQDDAARFMYNVYLARMGGDTERSLTAGLEAEDYIRKLAQIKKQIDEVISTHDEIQRANNAAKRENEANAAAIKAGTKKRIKMPYSYKRGEQNMYKLSNNSVGSLKEAIEDLAELLLPDDMAKDLADARAIVEEQNKLWLQTKRTTMSTEEIDYYKQTIADIEKAKKEIVDYLGSESKSKADEFIYFNLNTDEGVTELTRRLKNFSEQLNTMVSENADLLNSDRIFQQMTEDPDVILNKIKYGEDLPELGYGYDKAPTTSLDMHNIVASDTKVLDRLNTAKSTFASLQKSPAIKVIQDTLGVLNKKYESGTLLAKAFFADVQQQILATDKILTGNLAGFRNKFLENLRESKFLQKMTELGELNENTFARIVKEESTAFRSILKNTFKLEVLPDLPVGSFGRKLEEMIDVAVDRFVEHMKTEDSGGIQALVKRNLVEIDEAAQIADQVLAETKQKQLLDTMLVPLLEELTTAAADLQARAFNTQTNLVRVVEKCLKTPGKMNETILGEITSTILPREGASASIERLSDFNTEYRMFLRDLDRAGNDTEPLSEWALDANNIEEIREAIADRLAFERGLMSEAQLTAYDPNTKGGRVAKAYLDSLAQVQKNLHDLGSGKTTLATLFDPTKLSRAHEFLKQNYFSGRLYNNINRLASLTDTAYEKISAALKRFAPISSEKADLGRSNLSLHFLENLDLDAHFNPRGESPLSLNAVREGLLDGKIDELINIHGQQKVERAIEIITDGIWGGEKGFGLVDRLTLGTGKLSIEKASQKAKYLEDVRSPLVYKSLEAEKEAMKQFGFDNMKGWYEANMGTAKRAYAILNKCGDEPFAFYLGLKELMQTFVNDLGHTKYTAKQVKSMTDSLARSTFNTALEYALHSICGTFNNPSSAGIRWTQIATRIIGSPMLMKAGIKSITDYSYIFQDMVSLGLASGTDLQARIKVWDKLFNVMKSKKLAQALYMSQALKANIIQEALYNAPILSREFGAGAIKGGTGNLGEFASTITKAEMISKDWADTMLNKLAWIGPMTEYNRNNAALSIMQAIGDFANTSWDDMAKLNQGRLQTTLKRYGITQYEWDNILSKDAVINLNEHLAKTAGDDLGDLGDMQMFLPERLIDLEDSKIAKFLQDQDKEVTPEAIRMYKQNIVDKASMLVNASADEMISIPTIRIQGMLSFGQNPKDWKGALANLALQFQSFGAAVNFFHWGRRYMAHIDPTNPLFNNLLMSTSGFASTALDMTGFISDLAITQYFVNEFVSGITGTRRELHSNTGEFQWDALAEKSIKALVDQTGLASTLLDSIVTSVQRGRGSGGGMTLSILPVPSRIQKHISSVWDAATRTSTEGQRGKAVAGAMLQLAGQDIGLATHPLTQAVWNYFIGDKLTEWQMGTNYWKWLNQRRRNGYAPSWVSTTADYISDFFTN